MDKPVFDIHLELGDASLYLADSMRLLPLLPTVTHIITDPPYEAINHSAKKADNKRALRVDGGSELKALNFESVEGIRDEFTSLCVDLAQKWVIVFCAPEGIGRWADVINASPLKYKRACFWHKPDSAPQFNGQQPAYAVECFVAAWAGKGCSNWNGGGNRNLYTAPTNPKDRDGLHPTEKPWRLMAKIIEDFTNPGDTILDPFMGTGATALACLETGRKFIGIERDQAYFDRAATRIKTHQCQPRFNLKNPFTKPATQEAFV